MDPTQFRTPGQFVTALLEARGWTKRVLAIVLGVDEAVITRMAADKRSIDAEMALKLSEVFNVLPEHFLDLQKDYDLAVARFRALPDPDRATRATLFGDLPVSEMIKRGWLDDASMMDPRSVESALVKFFQVDTVNDIPILKHAAKKTDVASPATPAQIAWIYRVRQIAKGMLVGRYSPEAVRDAVERLKPLRTSADAARKAPRILAECGVRFVLVQTLPSANIDGVCLWLNDFAPVIGMTLRHDRIDNFWFVLRHECEHVIQRHGRNVVMLDADLDSHAADDIADEERVANAAASNFCVPKSEMDKFFKRKAPFFADRDIQGFANTIKVHPGLVAGQLRHRTGRYDRFNTHLVKIRASVIPNAIHDGWGDIAPVD